jgi:glyoxylase-like metal-dependent hydrolase (beta-lactamase superfamily II)
MPQVYADDQITIELLTALGPIENNSYILRSTTGDEIAVVDVPEGFEAVLEALGDDVAKVTHVLVTHSHFDHWGGYDVMRTGISAPVYAGAEETNLDDSRDVQPLAAGAEITLGGVSVGDVQAGTVTNGEAAYGEKRELRMGGATVTILHTPGHTPGSISLVTGGAVLTGDTLFPGGPGHSRSNEALQQEIESIISQLYPLPDATIVLPGHGDTTTIGESKAEYAVFAGKEHPADLAGDIAWLES